MPLNIRTVGVEDLDALLVLYHHLNPADPPLERSVAEEKLRAMVRQPGMTVLGGFADGTMVSSCTLIVIPNLTRAGASYALIENVVPHAGHRQKGYGQAVVRAAVDLALKAGCYKVMLLTGRADPAVHKFYARCGFEQTKTGFQVRSRT